MKNIFYLILIIITTIACDNNQSKVTDKDSTTNLKVFAVNYPLSYFAERIGGEHIDIFYPIPADDDPAYWVPYKSLDKIQNVDLILDNGANYAKWMKKVSLASSKVINTSKSFSDRYIKVKEGSTHSHGGDGEHVHYGYAFTTWLNFKYAEEQAKAILDVLILKRPQHKDLFLTNFKELQTELNALDQEMSVLSNKLQEGAIFGSHPVYQYLADAYGLNIISEHWEPGEFPSEKQWNEFMHNLEHNPSNLMLWEGEPLAEVSGKLNKMGVQVVVFNPCGNIPEGSDFIEMMKKNIVSLQNAL